MDASGHPDVLMGDGPPDADAKSVRASAPDRNADQRTLAVPLQDDEFKRLMDIRGSHMSAGKKHAAEANACMLVLRSRVKQQRAEAAHAPFPTPADAFLRASQRDVLIRYESAERARAALDLVDESKVRFASERRVELEIVNVSRTMKDAELQQFFRRLAPTCTVCNKEPEKDGCYFRSPTARAWVPEHEVMLLKDAPAMGPRPLVFYRLENSKKRVCSKCFESEHIFKNCKKPMLCGYCTKPGHRMSECPDEKASKTHASCLICRDAEHRTAYCPLARRGRVRISFDQEEVLAPRSARPRPAQQAQAPVSAPRNQAGQRSFSDVVQAAPGAPEHHAAVHDSRLALLDAKLDAMGQLVQVLVFLMAKQMNIDLQQISALTASASSFQISFAAPPMPPPVSAVPASLPAPASPSLEHKMAEAASPALSQSPRLVATPLSAAGAAAAVAAAAPPVVNAPALLPAAVAGASPLDVLAPAAPAVEAAAPAPRAGTSSQPERKHAVPAMFDKDGDDILTPSENQAGPSRPDDGASPPAKLQKSADKTRVPTSKRNNSGTSVAAKLASAAAAAAAAKASDSKSSSSSSSSKSAPDLNSGKRRAPERPSTD